MVVIQLVGGPLDGKAIRVLLGKAQRRYQEPEVVRTDARTEYHLHSYQLVMGGDGDLVYMYEGSAS